MRVRRLLLVATVLALGLVGRLEATLGQAPQSVVNNWFTAMEIAYNYGNTSQGDLLVREISRYCCHAVHWLL